MKRGRYEFSGISSVRIRPTSEASEMKSHHIKRNRKIKNDHAGKTFRTICSCHKNAHTSNLTLHMQANKAISMSDLFRARFCRDCVSRGMAAVITRPAPKFEHMQMKLACICDKLPKSKVFQSQKRSSLKKIKV